MSLRDIIVEAIAYGVLAILLSFVGLGIYLVGRVIRSAERADRRRYLLAIVTVIGSPIFFAIVARSLLWMHEQSRTVIIGRAEVVDVAFLGNLLGAMACSACGAFLMPFRSPRERGFAIIGSGLTAFAVYCMLSGPT